MELTSGIFQSILMGSKGPLEFLLTVFFLYGIDRNIFLFAKSYVSPDKNKRHIHYLKLLGSVVLLFIFTYSALIIVGVSINLINNSPSLSEVSNTSFSLMSMDKKIFGVYPPFWFHDPNNLSKPFWDSISGILIYVYKSLTAVLAVSWIITLLISPKLFYKQGIAWFLTNLISLPIWYLLPAISPQEVFVDKTLNISFPLYVNNLLANFSPNLNMVKAMEYYNHVWNSNHDGYFAITSCPSMHAAWATLLMYFMFKISKYSSIIFVPYWILSCIAAVYTMQHYAVDIPFGILIGTLCILISESFFTKEPKIIKNIGAFYSSDAEFYFGFIKRKILNRDG